eukprot:641409-Rhodomonas_salina.1
MRLIDALTAERSAAASPSLERLIVTTKWGRPQPGPPARPPSVLAEEGAWLEHEKIRHVQQIGDP